MKFETNKQMNKSRLLNSTNERIFELVFYPQNSRLSTWFYIIFFLFSSFKQILSIKWVNILISAQLLESECDNKSSIHSLCETPQRSQRNFFAFDSYTVVANESLNFLWIKRFILGQSLFRCTTFHLSKQEMNIYQNNRCQIWSIFLKWFKLRDYLLIKSFLQLQSLWYVCLGILF